MKSFYATLFGRRDVRSEFRRDPVPDEVLARILLAAHHAPSVGLSQPWNFILVRDPGVKRDVHTAFCDANAEAAAMFAPGRRDRYRQLKLQGIVDAPVNLCVTCDRQRGGDVVLGRTHQRDTDLYSTVCAVQNLWLAARAEEVGVGWVSIIEPARLRVILGLPEGVLPIAYLCLGYVTRFRQRPELEENQWERRRPVEELLFVDRWGARGDDDAVYRALSELRDWPRRILRPSRATRSKTKSRLPDAP